jgi:hypothetical protein
METFLRFGQTGLQGAAHDFKAFIVIPSHYHAIALLMEKPDRTPRRAEHRS